MSTNNSIISTQRLFFLFPMLYLLSLGCENVNGPGESPCEENRTASVTFLNRSLRSTYDVILNGARIGSIGPGFSITETVPAERHSVLFRFSNSNQIACSEAFPSFSPCDNRTLSCGAEQ